jgi:hypothetical protein
MLIPLSFDKQQALCRTMSSHEIDGTSHSSTSHLTSMVDGDGPTYMVGALGATTHKKKIENKFYCLK